METKHANRIAPLTNGKATQFGEAIDHEGVIITVETITPKRAAMDLKNLYKGQRRLNKRTVEKYARDMECGDWRFTDAALAYGPSGEVIQGQRRLNACVLSGVPFTTIVVRNLPLEAYLKLDNGDKRSANDVLRSYGASSVSLRAAIARRVWLAEYTGEFRDTYAITPSVGEVVDTALNHEYIEQAIDETERLRKVIRVIPSIAGCMWALCAPEAPGYTRWFFDRLRDGSGMKEGDPVLMLRNRIVSQAAKKDGLPQREWIALFIKAWNHMVAGQLIRTLRYRAAGPKAEDFPVLKFPEEDI